LRFNAHVRDPKRRIGITLTGGLLFALVMAFITASTAFAHAAYVSSDPQSNAVLTTAPTTVTVHFAEPLNPTGSAIIVYDAHHKQVSTAPAQVDQADLKTMSVPMRGDDSETYLVEWQTVSAVDGDPDIGAFTFTVSANATPTTGAPISSTASAATTTSNGSSQSGAPVWLVALTGVAGLVVGAGAMRFIRRDTR
jgi:methionine-rich copper-binding protein CopC